MKNLFKKLVGIVAALAIVATVIGPGVTAEAATVTGYTWEYTTDNGATWSTVPAAMKAAIYRIDYDGTDLTVISKGWVPIYGVQGRISVIRTTTPNSVFTSDNLLFDDEAFIPDVTAPFYLYFEIEQAAGTHSQVYTRISNLTY